MRSSLSLLLAAGSALAAWRVATRPAIPAPEPAPSVEVHDARDVERARALLAALAVAAQHPEPTISEARRGFERSVVDAARALLLRPPAGFRDDCSGFVSAVFTRVGVPMDGVVASLWDLAVEHDALHWSHAPRPGDLVFFDNSYDRNRNRRADDELSHIGVVLEVDADGTIAFAHAGTSAGPTVGAMNLGRPSLRRDEGGRELNDVLRPAYAWDPPDARRLTGELWIGFATVDPERPWLEWAPWVDLP